MAPIRILHILHSMNRGGAENALMNYYRHVDRDKIQFDFLLTEPNKCLFENEIESMGGRVFRIPLLDACNPLPYLKGIKAFLQSHPEYKIVHSHTSSKSLFPLYIAKTLDVPIRISHSHSSMAEKGLKGIIRKMLRPLLKKVATDWLSCGVQAGVYLYGKQAVQTRKVQVFRNVIEVEHYDFSLQVRTSLRQTLGITEDTIVVGHIARFDPVKNHRFGIDILVELLRKYPKVVLLEVGLGVKEGIYDYAQTRGVEEKIIFTGVVNNVADYEQVMDAFILPSFNEGLPLSIVEAQVSGLPCFTTEGGVSKECSITDLVTYIPLEDGAEVWATKIYESIARERKSRLQEIIAKGYSAKKSAKELQDFYIKRYNDIVL